MTQHILIIGCGDIGLRIALRHLARGDRVTGVLRRSSLAAPLREQGVNPLLADLDGDWTAPQADAIYWCAPPPTEGVDDPRLAHALAVLPAPARGFLYISTTGVYGDCQGRWIDEAEPLKPRSERGQRRLAAELHLRAWAARAGAKTVTLRVPGIYGPGRLPIERLRSGAPILRAEESPFTNRIHADDLADAAVLALAQGGAGAAYNVSDGEPTTMTDYFLQYAGLLGLPAPPQVSMAVAREQFSPMLLSFMEESKRMAPERLRALGWQPRHASLAAGLPHCL
ncbi:MAG: NAD-dependent epimerase/dehydratase family protein [Pseudomonadota bacterium]